jgi:hypothetical protein
VVLHRCQRLFGILTGLVLMVTTIPAATISGYVREGGTQESMPYVSVYLEGLRVGAMTNITGYYVITGVPPGDHTLIASLIGYAEYRTDLSINIEDVVQNITVESQTLQLGTVEVTAERVRAPSLEIMPSRETFRGMELKLAPAAVEADPIRTLQTLPGVVQLSDFNTGLYVRGGTPDQNLILVDGAELYNVSHLFGLFSTFPADAIKTTELLMGGYPAQYGGRLSSVLNVTTDEGNKETQHGTGGISMLSSRLTFEGPVGKGSYLLSGRRTYLEPMLHLADLDEFGYYFYDLQGKVHQIISHDDQITIAAYMGEDNFTFDNDFFDMQMKWGNWSASVMWTHLFSPQVYSHYQMNISRFDSRSRFQVEDFGFTDRNTLVDVDTKADFTWFANEHHTFELGGHLKRHNMRLVQEFANMEFEAFDISAWVPSVYIQDAWRPWPFLTIQPGVRASMFWAPESDQRGTPNYGKTTSYTDVNPRLSMRYQMGDQTYLKASVGRFTQYVFRVPREIQGISVFSDIWFTTDPSEEGGPQYSTHYITGLETGFGDDIDFTAEVYYKDYDDIAEFDYKASAPQSTGDALVRGSGYAYGLDLNLKKRAGRHMGWISYSTGWTVRKIAGIKTIDPNDPASPPQDFYPKYDQRHVTNTVYSFKWTDHWTINARFAYATGQGYTGTLGHYVIEGPIFTMTPSYKDYLNASRITAYSRLDVGIRGSFQGWGVTWMPFLQIVNVLNHDNEFNRFSTGGEWNIDHSNAEFAKEDSFGQLPILPTIGLDLEF